MPKTYRAFVSSTFEDLKEYRAQAIDALRKVGIDVAAMEDWTAASDEPKHLSENELRTPQYCEL